MLRPLKPSFQANRADIVTLDAGEVYSAVRQFGLVAVAKEIYSDGEFESLHSWTFSLFSLSITVWPCVCVELCTGGCILSVAVVNNSSLDISSLRGLRSCHSGVRWTAGWSLPLGFLLSRNYLTWSQEHPLSHGSNIRSHSCLDSWFLCCNLRIGGWTRTLCLSSPGQTSLAFSEPAAFLVPLPWRHLCALCAKVKSPTVSRRITTVRRLTANLSTTARGPSGQGQRTKHLFFPQDCKPSTMETFNAFTGSQMSQERSRRCCFCGPFSSGKYWG